MDSFPCGNNANCTNTEGSYYCNCSSGYSGNGTVCEGKDYLVKFYSALSNVYIHHCRTMSTSFILYADIDECELGTHLCHSNANCSNTDGGYNCNCISGFSGNGTDCKGKNGQYVLVITFFIRELVDSM